MTRNREENELLKQARVFNQLLVDLRAVRVAQEIAARHSCADLSSLAYTLRELTIELHAGLNALVTCDVCGGARREGHGEVCARCSGTGKALAWLVAGIEPPTASDLTKPEPKDPFEDDPDYNWQA
jgi:hypothetical protein